MATSSDTIAAGFDRGVFVVEGGYLEEDDEACRELAASLDPEVPYRTAPVS